MSEKINAFIDKVLTKIHLIKFRELIIYVIVGGLTTVVDWVVFWLLDKVISPIDLPDIIELITPNIIPYTIAWFAAVVFAYFANKLLVFRYGKGNNAKTFVSFLISRILSLAIAIAFDVILTSEMVGICMNKYVVKLISSVVVVVFNYVVGKWIVFKKNKKESDTEQVKTEGEKTDE
jgi:putative flippase GtrA